MTSAGFLERRGRALAMGVLLLLLCATFVWSGAAGDDRSREPVPDEEAVGPTPERYVGDRVELNGVVTETDPVLVQLWYDDGGWVVTVEGTGVSDTEIDSGAEISAYGVLTDQNTLEAERAVTREPWELTYMYLISVLGAAGVLYRAAAGWRFDRNEFAFVPRDSGTAATDASDEGGASHATDEPTEDEYADSNGGGRRG
ncbi:hypothetical protein [Natronolimnohabitans innermongolicus]|uniref:OB-fold tRNA/helicase-type nucleic acid binding protein n=1 Tax=Natronolimnohabitans innermongolicus JCM 12255 TaxID=1227499 RepID=L9XH41_9EURY|nr:hypothetical protein [Natronolimnohabitans innermongolicus]ELY60741.1 hypothetical protein C493_03522 [Natronolimnohabitans innermongolicus JCM 12255]